MDARLRRLLVVVVALTMLTLSLRSALAAGMTFSGDSPLALNLESDALLSVKAQFMDEYGVVVPAMKSTGEVVAGDGAVVLSVNGLDAGQGVYLFQKDLSTLPSGNYEFRVHLDGNQGVLPLVLARYPPVLGGFYNKGVLQKGRLVAAFIVLGVIAFIAILYLLIHFSGGRK